MTTKPLRIARIHALEESLTPIRDAFAQHWPDVHSFDLLDTSLAVDLAEAGGQLDSAMMDRFKTLADYVAQAPGKDGPADAILFTCSAFGAAIEAVKQRLSIPVMRPTEAAFEEALTLGNRIALVVTFQTSLTSLSAELHQMAAARGQEITITGVMVEGALAALKSGDGARHDALVAQACANLPEQDVMLLGQFSLARAAKILEPLVNYPVLTTPGCAVQTLRAKLSQNS